MFSSVLFVCIVTATAQSIRCGRDWGDANGRCGTGCPLRTDGECPPGEYCYADLSEAPCGGQPTPPSGGCPTIITRAQWGARAPRSRTDIASPVPLAVIHHGASAPCTTRAACEAQVRAYQNLHMDVNGWADIGYNFIVGEDGNIYEGRGWTTVGAHCPAYNRDSMGICVIGDFSSRAPNAAANAATQALIACGTSINRIQTLYGLRGHRDGCSTSCPGNAFYEVLRGWPRFGMLTDAALLNWTATSYKPGYFDNVTLELGDPHGTHTTEA